MPKLYDSRVILAEVETTYNDGTTTPIETDAVLVDKSSNIDAFSGEALQRNNVRGFSGGTPPINVKWQVPVSLRIEMAGSGAAGTEPAWGRFLEAAGWGKKVEAGVKVSYAPVYNCINSKSLTIVSWIDDIKQVVRGVRGNVKFELNVNGLCYLQFDGIGLYADPTTAAQVVPDLDAWEMPRPSNKFFTSGLELVGWTDAEMVDVMIDTGNNVVFHDTKRSESVMITERAMKGTASYEGVSLGTFNPYNKIKDTVVDTFSLQHGQVAGEIIKFSSDLSAINSVKNAERNGIWTPSSDLTFNPTGAASGFTPGATNEFLIEVY